MKLEPFVLSAMLFLTTANAFAATLEENMYVLAGGLRTVTQSNSAEEIHAALVTMKEAATDARRSIPKKLTGKASDSPEVAGYRAGIDQLIAQINVVEELVLKDQLAQAKEAAQELGNIARENHRKFN